MASRLFFKPSVTILIASVITGIIIHVMFHVCCISIHKLLFPLHDISVRTNCHIHQYACFLFFVFNYYDWPIWRNFVCVCVCVCVCARARACGGGAHAPHDSVILLHHHVWMLVLVCVCLCTICLLFQCLVLCILSNVNV
jgi:hypothetical protein